MHSIAAIDRAVRRLEDFSRVHYDSSLTERAGAATLLLEAVGFTSEHRDFLNERMTEFGLPEDVRSTGGFWLGVVVGLSIPEFDE